MIKRIMSLMLLFILAFTVRAQTKVLIPDTNFRNFLNDDYSFVMDTTGDSLIIANAASIGGTFVCYSRNIQDLTGIEYFKNITYLICQNNQLTILPSLDSLTALIHLDCSRNSLTALPSLLNNTALQTLDCSSNQLTVLPDLSSNINLVTLDCYWNQLTSLPSLSANIALGELSCGINQLTSLPNLSSNIALKLLACNINQLTTLPNLTANTALEYLDCRNNQLTTLPNLTSNIALTELWCSYNQLAALPDLSNNIALEWIQCRVNQLTAFPNLPSNTVLQNLFCDSNQLTALPGLSSAIALIKLYCHDNRLPAIPDLSSSSSLESFQCFNNNLDFSDTRELRIADSICFSNSFSANYAPQNPFGTADTFNLLAGDTLTLSIASQDSALYYQWLRGTTIVAGGPTDSILIIPNITGADDGVYTCRTYGDALKSPPMNWGPGLNGFVSEAFIVNVELTDIEESINQKSLSIYPNPSDGQFSIEINSTFKGMIELKIINLLGEEIYGESISNINNSYLQKIDVSQYAKGIYFLNLGTTEGILSQKIILSE